MTWSWLDCTTLVSSASKDNSESKSPPGLQASFWTLLDTALRLEERLLSMLKSLDGSFNCRRCSCSKGQDWIEDRWRYQALLDTAAYNLHNSENQYYVLSRFDPNLSLVGERVRCIFTAASFWKKKEHHRYFDPDAMMMEQSPGQEAASFYTFHTKI